MPLVNKIDQKHAAALQCAREYAHADARCVFLEWMNVLEWYYQCPSQTTDGTNRNLTPLSELHSSLGSRTTVFSG